MAPRAAAKAAAGASAVPKDTPAQQVQNPPVVVQEPTGAADTSSGAAVSVQPPPSDPSGSPEGSAVKVPEATGAPAAAPAKGEEQPRKADLVVLAGAVVLRTAAGSDKYLYRGATVARKAYTDESIKHALAVGLIGKPAK